MSRLTYRTKSSGQSYVTPIKFSKGSGLEMATLEKLIRTIDQLKIPESAQSDFHVKKKELRTHLLNLSEFVSSLNVQNHKDFVSYIGPSIDSLIQLSDSKDSDIRLACDEGLYKVIKVCNF